MKFVIVCEGWMNGRLRPSRQAYRIYGTSSFADLNQAYKAMDVVIEHNKGAGWFSDVKYLIVEQVK